MRLIAFLFLAAFALAGVMRYSKAAAPEPAKRTKPIETIKVGLVQTPYKRRNGYHVEVAVQHAHREESIHRLWFGFEVLDFWLGGAVPEFAIEVEACEGVSGTGGEAGGVAFREEVEFEA